MQRWRPPSRRRAHGRLMPAVQRGAVLHRICNALEAHQQELAEIVARETGKSPKEAFGEAGGAIALGRFFAGEGQRLYGRTTTSGTPDKYAMTVRQPCGVAGLIIAANTPIANVAWKVFPALICGNAAVLKGAEDTPGTSWLFAKIAHEAGLPPGVLNVIQGFGLEGGAPLVEHPICRRGELHRLDQGRRMDRRGVRQEPQEGLARARRQEPADRVRRRRSRRGGEVGVPLGLLQCRAALRGRQPHHRVRCRLRRLPRQARRCAPRRSRSGPTTATISGRSSTSASSTPCSPRSTRPRAKARGCLTGGERLTDPAHAKGFYLAPTVIENAAPDADISRHELFGPIACLYRVGGYDEAVAARQRFAIRAHRLHSHQKRRPRHRLRP